MSFCSETELSALRESVRSRMSERRFMHTLGVERMAKKLAKIFLPSEISAVCAAALLHDVAKELPMERQRALMSQRSDSLTASDLACPAIFHSFAGAALIPIDFPRFADEKILSAVAAHTVGNSDMSPFDEIIFLSDFIEDGRTYSESIGLRKRFFAELAAAKTAEERTLALHRAALCAAESTLENLYKTGKTVGETLILTKELLKSRILSES